MTYHEMSSDSDSGGSIGGNISTQSSGSEITQSSDDLSTETPRSDTDGPSFNDLSGISSNDASTLSLDSSAFNYKLGLKRFPIYSSYLRTGIAPDEFFDAFADPERRFVMAPQQANVSAVRESISENIAAFIWFEEQEQGGQDKLYSPAKKPENKQYMLPKYSDVRYVLALQDVFGESRQTFNLHTGINLVFQGNLPSVLWSFSVGSQQASATAVNRDNQLETILWVEKSPSMIMNLVSCPALNWEDIQTEDKLLPFIKTVWEKGDDIVAQLHLVHSDDPNDFRAKVKRVDYLKDKLVPLQCLSELMDEVTDKFRAKEARPPVFVCFDQRPYLSSKSQENAVDLKKLFISYTTVGAEYRRYVDPAVGTDYFAIEEATRSAELFILAQRFAGNSFSNSSQFVRAVQRMARVTQPDDEQHQLLRLLQRAQIDSTAVTQWPVDGFYTHRKPELVPQRFNDLIETNADVINFIRVNLQKFRDDRTYQATLSSAVL